MQKQPIFFLMCIALVAPLACTKNKTEPIPQDTKQIVGLASPILIDGDTTTVLLDDYFQDISKIDSITLTNTDGSIASLWQKNSNELKLIAVYMDKLPLLSVLNATVEGKKYSILIKKSQKQSIELTFKADKSKKIEFAGDMTNWKPEKMNFDASKNQFIAKLRLYAGKYNYKIINEGQWISDPNSIDSNANGQGAFNSVLNVKTPAEDKICQLNTQTFEGNKIIIAIKNKSLRTFAFWNNYALDCQNTSPETLQIDIPDAAKNEERSFVRILAYNEFGISNDILIPLQKGKIIDQTSQLNRHDAQANIMYFTFVDRFNDGSKNNNFPLKDPRVRPEVNYQGGDIVGITQKIKDGYFKKLGINTIWISPIVQNPLEAYQEYPAPHFFYSGYHGYWPISTTSVDFRFGNEQELKTLIDLAHANDINVLLDIVANHTHQEHPLYQKHPEYFNKIDLPDGRKNIRIWDEQRLTTWFDTFMPDVNYDNPEAMKIQTDSALYWLKHYGFDGFRHDATKHIPEIFWRTLTKKIKNEVIIKEKRPIYQIGETFGSRELINSYISTGMLNAQFDFNLYFDAVNVFGPQNQSFDLMNKSLLETFAYYGNHHTMGNITGNHDLTRFIGLAGEAVDPKEDPKMAGFIRKVTLKNKIGYKKLQSLTAMLMTIPGIPIVYYGDEIGMVGAGDPDNRRMMRFENLTPEEQETKQNAQKLINLRRNRMSLLYGDFVPLLVEQDAWVYARVYFDEVSLVVFNKSNEKKTIDLNSLKAFSPSKKIDKLKSNFGDHQINNNLELTLPAYSFDIFTN